MRLGCSLVGRRRKVLREGRGCRIVVARVVVAAAGRSRTEAVGEDSLVEAGSLVVVGSLAAVGIAGGDSRPAGDSRRGLTL